MENNVFDYMFYVLEDGSVWNIPEAKFVSFVPDGAEFKYPYAEDGSYGIAGLESCLRFFGYPLGQFKNDEDFASEVRANRDELLAETDFTMIPDYPISEDKHRAIVVYRQALRDIPQQPGFPRQITWPEKPEI